MIAWSLRVVTQKNAPETGFLGKLLSEKLCRKRPYQERLCSIRRAACALCGPAAMGRVYKKTQPCVKRERK